MLKLVSLQTIQVECFIFTRITGVTPAKHVITTYVFTPLHLRVKNTFPSFTFIPIIDIVFFELMDCEGRLCIEHFLAIRAGVSRHVIMFPLSYWFSDIVFHSGHTSTFLRHFAYNLLGWWGTVNADGLQKKKQRYLSSSLCFLCILFCFIAFLSCLNLMVSFLCV